MHENGIERGKDLRGYPLFAFGGDTFWPAASVAYAAQARAWLDGAPESPRPDGLDLDGALRGRLLRQPVVLTYPKMRELDQMKRLRIALDISVTWLFFFLAWSAFYLATRVQAEARDAVDAPGEDLPHPVGEEGGDVAVDGVALGLHRAPLEHRDVLADLLEFLVFAGGGAGAVANKEAGAGPCGTCPRNLLRVSGSRRSRTGRSSLPRDVPRGLRCRGSR